MIHWDKITKDDAEKIHKIAMRAARLAAKAGVVKSVLDLEMDISACHLVGYPLDLDKLSSFDDFNLGHDVFGIHRFINRESGVLSGFFVPRSGAK